MNNREIKFRAWDRTNACWIIRWDDNDVENQLTPRHGGGWTMRLMPSDVIKLMQYTGLRDKNGVEIYEGDLIAFNLHQIPHEVVFGDGAFWAWERHTTSRRELVSTAAANPNCEVVANIYEVPTTL